MTTVAEAFSESGVGAGVVRLKLGCRYRKESEVVEAMDQRWSVLLAHNKYMATPDDVVNLVKTRYELPDCLAAFA